MSARTVEAAMRANPPVPDHLLTVEEWDDIEETETTRRYELVEGVIVVSPSPLPLHQLVSRRLANEIDQNTANDVIALQDVEVAVDTRFPPTIRQPDVVVATAAAVRSNPPRFSPSDVALVVEIISPGSRRIDRVLKFAEYQDAGIASYWIVDPRASRAERFRAFDLQDGRYVEVAGGDGPVELTRPAPMTLDVSALLRWE